MTIYKFRNCFLNSAERRVIRDGKYLDLTPKTFDVLQLLVEKTGDIVTKDEILGNVWNGSFVEEGNLPVHISKLRRSLDETGSERFIETVQGAGYRFTATVVTVSEDEWLKQLSVSKRRQTDNLPTELLFDSIAVLPLQNESNNPDIDYLADGLTESFINSLSRIPDLKVLARETVFRYKNKDTEAKDVGETLGVAAILTGRIKLIQDRLTIGVELVKVEDGSQLWGTHYNQPFSDIIQIQEEITLAVAETLRSELSQVARSPNIRTLTQNPESFRLYLKGKYFQEIRTKSDLYKAIECFQKSVAHDASNVYSYVETFECYFLLYLNDHLSYSDVMPIIRPILKVVQELNQSVDVVHVMYGAIKMYLEWRFDEAGAHLRHALSINPSSLTALYRYSDFLMVSGRFSEALETLERIMLMDTMSALTSKRIGRMLWKTGRYENAIVYLEDAVEMQPGDFEALLLLGAVLTEQGKYGEALDAFRQAMSIQDNVESLSMIGYVYALEGKREEALEIIDRIKSHSNSDVNKHHLMLARIYTALKEEEISYRYLFEALAQHDLELIAISFDPRLNAIRHEPKFEAVLRQVGLPII